MFSKFEFHNNASQVLQFDIGETPPNVGRPIKELQFEYNNVNTRRPKMEKVGSWPGFLYIRECLVHTTFDILYDTTDEFNTSKLEITSKVYPDPDVLQTVETLGTLVIRMDGQTEDFEAPVVIDGDISILDRFPTYGVDSQITWVAPQGYFVGSTTGNKFYPK